jgi:hypothetical protein
MKRGDRLKNRSLVQTWLQEPDYCPLIGHNPGFVIGLLTGHNNFRRYLYIMQLIDNPICKKFGAEEETSAHILCECEALASLRHAYLGSFFLNPEDIRKLSIGSIWNPAKGTGLHLLSVEYGAQRVCFKA